MLKSAVWIRRGAVTALVASTMVLAACGGGGGKSATNNTANPSGNAAPTITASPAAQISVGADYDMMPVARDPDGDTLAFSIQNRPSWATFSTATGQLTGKPSAAGAFANIVISVSDGKTSAALPSFSITVTDVGGSPSTGKAVALSWDVPTQTADGQSIDGLSGYRIHYGTRKDALAQSVEIPSAGILNHVIEGLKPGTYYFAIRAVTSDGGQSELSNVISHIVS